MHPYPTMIKKRSFGKGRVFQTGAEFARISSVMEGRKATPPILKRCVRAVAMQYGGDISKAFAICTAQMQKAGLLKSGTGKPTKAGIKSGRRKAADAGHPGKLSDYEGLLRLNRKGK